MSHGHSYSKAPKAKIARCDGLMHEHNGIPDYHCGTYTVEISLSSGRSKQKLSLKQAENLSKKLAELVKLAQVQSVHDS